jgi:hypothetical protein
VSTSTSGSAPDTTGPAEVAPTLDGPVPKTLGFLDQGDEVQLLERQGTYWLVLCPNGGQGWIHKMTLGEVVADENAPPQHGATATMPIAADTWTMGDDVDDDVLTAYLQSRERRE